MQVDSGTLSVRQIVIRSEKLNRNVAVDIYQPAFLIDGSSHLLLINDGQNLPEMGFASILEDLYSSGQIQPLICIGIHAGVDRKQEYGTARILDYEQRGSKAKYYNEFILSELLPYIYANLFSKEFTSISLAGFSLGGLTAIDMVWHNPQLFRTAGVFSGSLWWRTKSLSDDYNDETDRIMHMQIRNADYKPGLRFFFTTGTLDETADRNNNGIIDSIDDTLDLINELKFKGYQPDRDIQYINFEDGRHDIATWGRSMPLFLKWGWGK